MRDRLYFHVLHVFVILYPVLNMLLMIILCSGYMFIIFIIIFISIKIIIIIAN